METITEAELLWNVGAIINICPDPWERVSPARIKAAIKKVVQNKPWLIQTEAGQVPAKITVWCREILKREDQYRLQLERRLKASQLRAFHLFLREILKELSRMDIPNVHSVSGFVDVRGKNITFYSNS